MIKDIAYPQEENFTSLLYSERLPFLKPFSGKSIIPILNGSNTSIRFKHEKMGRKISKGNAPAVAAQKMPFGIRILK